MAEDDEVIQLGHTVGNRSRWGVLNRSCGGVAAHRAVPGDRFNYWIPRLHCIMRLQGISCLSVKRAKKSPSASLRGTRKLKKKQS
ncbi:hypothetical protein DUNSADRAFT_15843 [Dunaliella salina]|uniref:Encoded protein n=1 Tax=Dunaliella salina TaxID=3046 RepID=A0ABQ7G4U5_DUNSA|nr:hypothetical protein DUNSADRAFT_15843 [Dunaliella salina]|eukprot:KAF5829624.1 hypothetical protein DUNSADRAFT_15843 [Dunaliella salina]